MLPIVFLHPAYLFCLSSHPFDLRLQVHCCCSSALPFRAVFFPRLRPFPSSGAGSGAVANRLSRPSGASRASTSRRQPRVRRPIVRRAFRSCTGRKCNRPPASRHIALSMPRGPKYPVRAISPDRKSTRLNSSHRT